MKLPPPYFAALLALAAAVALLEFYTMYRVDRTLKYAGVALGALIIGARHAGMFTDALLLSIILIAAIRLFMRPEPKSSLSDMAPVVFGLLYLPGLLSVQIPLREAAPEFVLFLYATVWSSDAAAYYVGGAIGRRKLYESMSPKKTWAGAVGSLCGGTAAAVIMKYALIKSLPLEVALTAGLVTGAVAVIGDLVESMLKRDAGVKDSGVLVPGHGGLLDKIDGSVFAGPVLLWMLSAFDVLPKGLRLPF